MLRAAEGCRKASSFIYARLNRLQMIEIGPQHFPLKKKTHALAFAFKLNEARVLQLFYMVGERRGGDGLALAHISAKYASAPFADLLENLMTARVGQGFGDEPDLALG